jgi:hypothetical protein
MLFRASAKFRRQYSCALEKRDPPVQPFPQTWNLDVLSHGRSQMLVLASEEYTLFSVLVPTGRVRNSESFLIPFRERLLQLFENVRIRFADRPALGPVTLVGRTDRKIIGSQNDLLFMTRRFLNDSEKPASSETLRMIEEHLNATPMSYLAMDSPLEALRRKTAWLKAC